MENNKIVVDIGDSNVACEFGYEVIMAIPYAYYLYKNNMLRSVKTCSQMKEFYYFLSDDMYEEKYSKRGWVIPSGLPLKTIHFKILNQNQWEMPPYKKFFYREEVKGFFDKEVIIINNKYNSEWGGDPVNFLDIKTLQALFDLLCPFYTVVYNRPKKNTIPDDHSDVYDLGDFKLISEKYPEVINLNDFYKGRFKNYNHCQLSIGAVCNKQISVQGGSSILSSLNSGENLVFVVKGSEIANNSYNSWYKHFSGCDVKSFSSTEDLIEEVKKRFLS